MTPTEQDKELREQLVAGGYRLDTNQGMERTIKFIQAYTDQVVQAFGEKAIQAIKDEIKAVEGVDNIMQLITADRKRVALEARVDELQALNEQREWQSLGGVYKEINERIAELKAQQEEV